MNFLYFTSIVQKAQTNLLVLDFGENQITVQIPWPKSNLRDLQYVEGHINLNCILYFIGAEEMQFWLKMIRSPLLPAQIICRSL